MPKVKFLKIISLSVVLILSNFIMWAVENKGLTPAKETIFLSFKDFPNLHPLIVHFPIVLLILAFLAQLIALIIRRIDLNLIIIFLLLTGFIGAILAVTVFHAHPSGLPEQAHEIFERHELLGKTTAFLAGIALALKILSYWLFKSKLLPEIILLLFVTASAVSVSLAGHLGSQMVYIEGIGPKGNYLEEHDQD